MDNARVDDKGMGVALNVDFDNKASVIVYLDSKAGDPLFDEIILNKHKRSTQPHTDGEKVYWSNGANLTVCEILSMLRTNHDKKDE
jgi:hypothetical protein